MYVTSLKAKLYRGFPTFESYGSNNQDDAGFPFGHIVEGLPSVKEMFQIKAQKRYQCLQCKGTEDAVPAPWMTDNKGNMDLAFSGTLEDL